MALKSNYIELEDTSTSSYGAVSYIIRNSCFLGCLCIRGAGLTCRGWSLLEMSLAPLQESYGTFRSTSFAFQYERVVHVYLLPVNALHSILRSGCRL